MSRSTLDEQVEAGLLTAPSAAELMPMSRTTIASLGRRGIIQRIATPGIRETRFSAMELFKYIITNRLLLNPKLQKAAENYASKYGQQEEYLKLTLHCKLDTVKTETKPDTEVASG